MRPDDIEFAACMRWLIRTCVIGFGVVVIFTLAISMLVVGIVSVWDGVTP